MATFVTKLLRSNGELETICGVVQLLLPFLFFASDSLCGLSGCDSIARNLAASFDISSPLLFLCGLYTFVFKATGTRQIARDYLKRWSRLHSDPLQNMKKGLKVDIRSSRFPWLTTVARVGKIQVVKVFERKIPSDNFGTNDL